GPESDGRNIPVRELNERRAAAVHLRLGGASIAEAAREAGLSPPTVIRAYKAYEAGGWSAVPVAERGRRPRRKGEIGKALALPAVSRPRLGPSPSPDLVSGGLTHLERLEAEAIHVMREAVAGAENPVMLYSIGKD